MNKKELKELLDAQHNLNCAVANMMQKIGKNSLVSYSSECSRLAAAWENMHEKVKPVLAFLELPE